MIVFGTRGKMIPGPRKQGLVCGNCGKEEHQTYGVLRYFHVFWIPMFPTTKQPVLECVHCKKVLAGKEVPDRSRREIAEKVFTRGRVLPMFTGLALFAGFFGLGAVGAAVDDQKEAAWLAAPAVGDVYVVKLAPFATTGTDPKYPYGILRVSGVGGGNVRVQLGRYGYDRARGAEQAVRKGELAKPDYFDAEPLTVAAEKLGPLKQSGSIYSVKRL